MRAIVLLISCIRGAADLGPALAESSQPTGVRRITPALAVDFDHRFVALEAQVVLREGPLELFLCPRGTKEHESILAADVEPRAFQLALLLVGAVPGSPARVETEREAQGELAGRFLPPTGQRLKIWVELREGSRHRLIDARQWIRDTTDGKPMMAPFVFAGSGFAKVPGLDRPVFLGSDGDLICVANFPGAVIDVALRSSADNVERLFEAYTERIPSLGTKVRLIIEPITD